jgi:uncharacterized protein
MPSNIYFEWPPRKAEANKRKHKVSFESAARVFSDPFVSHEIEGTDYGEVRFRATGEVDGELIVVSYTLRETPYEEEEVEIVRIISARRATRGERRTYQGNT